MNILLYLLLIIGGAVGIFTIVVLTLGIPVVIVWKIYRRIRFHISLMD